MREHRRAIVLVSCSLVVGIAALRASAAADQPVKDQPSTPRTDSDGQPAPEARADGVIAQFRSAIRSLKLSDEQRVRIDKLFERAQSDLRDIVAQAHGDTQEARQKSQEVVAKLREEVNAALTEAQRLALRQSVQGERVRQMFDRLKSNLQKLNLSAEQKQKVHDVLTEAQAHAKELAREARGGAQDARERFRSFLQDTREKLRGILSEDQKQKLQDLNRRDSDGQDGRRSDDQQ